MRINEIALLTVNLELQLVISNLPKLKNEPSTLVYALILTQVNATFGECMCMMFEREVECKSYFGTMGFTVVKFQPLVINLKFSDQGTPYTCCLDDF